MVGRQKWHLAMAESWKIESLQCLADLTGKMVGGDMFLGCQCHGCTMIDYDVSPCIFLGCPTLELQNGVCLKVMIYFETSVCVDDLQLLLE